MVLLGINKRPTEYKEVDDKDWIRESSEKFKEFSRLSELVQSGVVRIDYYNRAVKLLFKDSKLWDEERSRKLDGAIGQVVTFYDKNDGIDFLILGIDPDSIKYQGFSNKFQHIEELSEEGKKSFIERLNKKTSEPYELSHGYSWKDIRNSLNEYNSILVSGKTCPKCEHNTVYIYFRSPSYTWAGLCGTVGPMEICPYCLEQLSYQEESMN